MRSLLLPLASLLLLLAMAAAGPAAPYESPMARFAESMTSAGSKVEARGGLDYRADSGGCTPLTDWTKYDSKHHWAHWEARLTSLATKVKGMNHKDRAAAVLEGLGRSNFWMQILDGWTQLKGPNSFEPHYVPDAQAANDEAVNALKAGLTEGNTGYELYGKIHDIAFRQSATALNKRNGFRGDNSWIYLPCPDKPAGVFHDVHDEGKVAFDQSMRLFNTNGDKKGTTWNDGYQMRWQYPNHDQEWMKTKVNNYFGDFWRVANSFSGKVNVKTYREEMFKAISDLYHNLENLHPFVDGTGRTNYLILNMLLSFVGLHPVSLYNTMESALCSRVEERQKVLEGYFRWEETYLNIEKGASPATSWTEEAIQVKNKECDFAIDVLMGKVKAPSGYFVPDTLGGCMCKSASECSSFKKNGREACHTDGSCLWNWDYCAPGRQH